ncbi:MAG: type II toxin-antitoxin system VapC family toxin [Xanthobacteraceae bacterium]
MQPLLLDTCAVIWLAEDEPIAQEAADALNAAHAAGVATYISPITAWEVGLLAARERLKLLITPERWFDRLLALPNVRLAEMRPDVLIASSFLPGKAPRDRADRIIAATARDLGCTLMTRDRALLEYGEQGHVKILAC